MIYLYQHLKNLSVVAFGYVASYFIVEKIFGTFEAAFNSNYLLASLFFLPHGVRILATLIFGPGAAFIYLLFSSMLVTLIPNFGSDLALSFQVAQNTVGAASAPIAFKILSFTLGDNEVYFKKISLRSWRILLLAIVLASVINSIGQTLVVDISAIDHIDMSLLLSYLTGDFFGAVTIIFICRLALNRLNS